MLSATFRVVTGVAQLSSAASSHTLAIASLNDVACGVLRVQLTKKRREAQSKHLWPERAVPQSASLRSYSTLRTTSRPTRSSRAMRYQHIYTLPRNARSAQVD